MADYTPLVVNESDIRNFVTPPLDYDDITKAEILLKIESVETFVKYKYFGGGTIISSARIPVMLLIISNVISSSKLAKKYCMLNSERLGDYSYTIAEPARDAKTQNNPYVIIETWHDMAIEMLEKMASPSDYIVRKVNG